MNILFDQQIFVMQRYGGISRYFARLAEQLSELGEEVTVVSLLNQNAYLSALPRKNVNGISVECFLPRTGELVKLFNRYYAHLLEKRFDPDVIHETYFAAQPPIVAKRSARVLTVYDMIHEKFIQEFGSDNQTKELKKRAINRSDHVIVISQSTKIDLCETLDINPDKVTVVHLGFDHFSKTTTTVEFTPTRPFLLYVGKRSGYKNFNRLIRAVASNRHLKEQLGIIAFGGGVFSASEVDLIRSVGLNANSVQHVAGDDSVLGGLYHSATALVYPSLYEGFGLPPLEAMAHGCPVVSSNASSMPEVIDSAGEYFDPTDIDAIANAIERAVFDSVRRGELIQAGKQRIELFSWRKCAQETRAVYRNVLGATSK